MSIPDTPQKYINAGSVLVPDQLISIETAEVIKLPTAVGSLMTSAVSIEITDQRDSLPLSDFLLTFPRDIIFKEMTS